MIKSNDIYDISLYTSQDARGVSALLESNTVSCGGTLTSDYSPSRIKEMAQFYEIVVARLRGEVVGVLMALEKGRIPLKPLWVSVLEVWEGEEKAYLYGPVCVANEHKGRRLIARLWEFMYRHTQGREVILSIRKDNEASLRAHRRLGMREVGSLSQDHTGERWVFTSRPL